MNRKHSNRLYHCVITQVSDCAQPSHLPLRYISQAELASVSSYMRGRLTIETVNSAIDDAASHSEANAKLMAATKSNSVKPADRKRATTLLHCVAVCAMCHLPISMPSTET